MRTRTIYLSILFIYSAIFVCLLLLLPPLLVAVVLFLPFIIVLLWLLCFAAAAFGSDTLSAYIKIQPFKKETGHRQITSLSGNLLPLAQHTHTMFVCVCAICTTHSKKTSHINSIEKYRLQSSFTTRKIGNFTENELKALHLFWWNFHSAFFCELLGIPIRRYTAFMVEWTEFLVYKSVMFQVVELRFNLSRSTNHL